MERVYPTIKGVGVSPFELVTRDSHLDLENTRNWNNHHVGFTARNFAGLALFQTFRDLERHQFITPLDIHSEAHRLYAPPVMPTIKEAMDVIVEAYDAGERLRYGSALNPIYKPLGLDTLKRVTKEYNEKRASWES